MKGVIIAVVVVLLVGGLAAGGKLVGIRNDLVVQRESITGQWAQVDVALRRRADLIPNLVETVRGYAKQEQDVFGRIADARSRLLNARSPQESIAANNQLDTAIGRLLVVVESYPQLKSNDNFVRLQDELAGTENRIAVERRKYNEAVQRYNTNIELFPNNVAAGLFGFTRSDAYFRTEGTAREVPQVKF